VSTEPVSVSVSVQTDLKINGTEVFFFRKGMDEDEIPDVGITSGHGTFVTDTGDVMGHKSVVCSSGAQVVGG
jgi:hypothetical protein